MSAFSDSVSFMAGGLFVGLIWLGGWPFAMLVAVAWLIGFRETNS